MTFSAYTNSVTGIELEESILGSILDNRLSGLDTIPLLSVECFSISNHRQLFQLMLDIQASGGTPDFLTVAYALSKKPPHVVEAIGGNAKLHQLIDRIRFGDQIQYARMLKEEYLASYIASKVNNVAKIAEGYDDLPTKMAEIKKEFQEMESFVPQFRENSFTDLKAVRLKLDIQSLLQETDPFAKAPLRSKICSNYRITKREVDELIQILQQQNATPEKVWFPLSEILEQSAPAIPYLIPELLPRGEAILILGRPKEGKTLLAVDLAFAVATEAEFLGRKVQKGKVLIISADESVQSLQSKLNKRGFLPEDSDQVFIAPKWDMSQMHLLEEKLESFKPDCVIIDSLKRICLGSSISENSAEFADNIYLLKELCSKHDAALCLIHHTNKDKELKGLDRVRGSSAIAGAVWATWLLESLEPKNPECSQRRFSLTARDAQGQVFELDLDLEDHHWVRVDSDREDTQTLKLKERILGILELNRHREGLSTPEIKEYLGLSKDDRSIYTCLNRMVDAREIQRRPSSSDRRKKIYCLPFIDPPQPPQGTPPSPTSPESELNIAESLTQSQFEDTQQITQQNSEITQQPSEITQQNPESIVLSNPKLGLAVVLAFTQQIIELGGEYLPEEQVSSDIQDTEQQIIPIEVSEPDQPEEELSPSQRRWKERRANENQLPFYVGQIVKYENEPYKVEVPGHAHT